MNERQTRISFYKEKYAAYEARHPGHQPSDSTVRRWVKECNQHLIKEDQA